MVPYHHVHPVHLAAPARASFERVIVVDGGGVAKPLQAPKDENLAVGIRGQQ